MENKSKIESVYTDIKNTLNGIYKKRRTTLFAQKLIWGIAGVFFMAILLTFLLPNLGIRVNLYKFYPKNHLFIFAPIVFLFVLVYVGNYVFVKSLAKFKILEKNAIEKMISRLFPGFIYKTDNRIGHNELIKSKIFSWIDEDLTITSFGCIEGQHNGTDMKVFDVGVAEENAKQAIGEGLMQIPFLNVLVMIYKFVIKNIFTSKTSEQSLYSFRGMFCEASFSKKIQGHTVLLSNNIGNKFDKKLGSYFNKEEKIELEDARFNNEFVVYGTDQVESRYVLSLAFMEKITALKKKLNKPVMVSFVGDKMYFSIADPNGLFSFQAGKLEKIEVVENMFNEINEAFSTVEHLEINRRKAS